jgi:hypothetical protein
VNVLLSELCVSEFSFVFVPPVMLFLIGLELVSDLVLGEVHVITCVLCDCLKS